MSAFVHPTTYPAQYQCGRIPLLFTPCCVCPAAYRSPQCISAEAQKCSPEQELRHSLQHIELNTSMKKKHTHKTRNTSQKKEWYCINQTTMQHLKKKSFHVTTRWALAIQNHLSGHYERPRCEPQLGYSYLSLIAACVLQRCVFGRPRCKHATRFGATENRCLGGRAERKELQQYSTPGTAGTPHC